MGQTYLQIVVGGTLGITTQLFHQTLSLRYKRQPRPRRNNSTIMATLMQHNIQESTLLRMNRCRNYPNVLFLSKIRTADGKYIDRHFLCMSPSPADSDLSFPQEQPTRQDWQVWRSTWYGVTLQSGQLQSPLGEWVNRPLSRWRWLHHQKRTTSS